MFFNKSRLKAISKDLYENNPKFYQRRLKLKELKELFTYYNKVKNFEKSFLGAVCNPINLTLIETLFTLGGSTLFCFLLFGILGKSDLPHPNLLISITDESSDVINLVSNLIILFL